MREIDATLDHLVVDSPQPERMARFYEDVFGMAASPTHDGGILCQGPSRRLVLRPAERPALRSAVFAFAHAGAADGHRRRLIDSGLEVRAAASFLFEGEGYEVADPDGGWMGFGVAAASPQRNRTDLAGRLQHFAVRSDQPHRLAQHYAGPIGFKTSDRVIDDGGELRACFLRSDPEHHSMAIFAASGRQFDHLSFETDSWESVKRWADHVSRQNTPLVWGVGRHGPGNDLFFMVRDPDGNLVEISAELEVCAPERPEQVWPHEATTLNRWGQAIMRS